MKTVHKLDPAQITQKMKQRQTIKHEQERVTMLDLKKITTYTTSFNTRRLTPPLHKTSPLPTTQLKCSRFSFTVTTRPHTDNTPHQIPNSGSKYPSLHAFVPTQDEKNYKIRNAHRAIQPLNYAGKKL